MNAPIKKYRAPSLSLENVEAILRLATATNVGHVPGSIDKEAMDLIAIFHPFKAKIESSAIGVSHVQEIRIGLEQQLGMDLPSGLQTVDKTIYWEQCYNKWAGLVMEDAHTHELEKYLSTDEIIAVIEHMYLHELLNSEQITSFEAGKPWSDIL